MYLPPHFAEDHLPTLHEIVRARPLAALTTWGATGLEANHLPLWLDPDEGPFGTLYGHLARQNPQSRTADPAVEALAIFTGPDAYVSPSWYPSKAATGKAVPTWNYVAVHAWGSLDFFDDAPSLHRIVSRLTAQLEAGRPDPWSVDDAPADYLAAMLKGIIGVKMTVTRWEGKRKLSQNRDAGDRAGVIAGLTHDDPGHPLARLMGDIAGGGA